MALVRTIACLIVATLGFAPVAAGAAERVYFIAADEVVWDFAPSYPNNPITGVPFTTDESVYLRRAKDRVGRKYLKAIYREYTDASFATLKPRGPAEESQRNPRAGYPRRGRRHNHRRIPQQHSVSGRHSPPRGLLRQVVRGGTLHDGYRPDG